MSRLPLPRVHTLCRVLEEWPSPGQPLQGACRASSSPRNQGALPFSRFPAGNSLPGTLGYLFYTLINAANYRGLLKSGSELQAITVQA